MMIKLINLILIFISILLVVNMIIRPIEKFNISTDVLGDSKNICEKMKEFLEKNNSQKDQVGIIRSKFLPTVVPYEKDLNHCTDGNYYDFSELTLPTKHDIDNFYMIFLPEEFNKTFNISFYFKPKRQNKEYILNYSKTDGSVLAQIGVNELGQLFYSFNGDGQELIFDNSLELFDDRFYYLELDVNAEKSRIFFENLEVEKPSVELEEADCPVLIIGRKNNNLKEQLNSFDGIVGSIRVRPNQDTLGKYYKATDDVLIYDTPKGITQNACKQDCISKTKNDIYCDRLCEGCIDPKDCLWLELSEEEKNSKKENNENIEPPKLSAISGDGKVTLIWAKNQEQVDNYIIEVNGTYSNIDKRVINFSANQCRGTECRVIIDNLINGEYYNISVKSQVGSQTSEKCSNVLSIAPNGIKMDATIHDALIDTDEALLANLNTVQSKMNVCENKQLKLNNKSLLDNYSLNL